MNQYTPEEYRALYESWRQVARLDSASTSTAGAIWSAYEQLFTGNYRSLIPCFSCMGKTFDALTLVKRKFYTLPAPEESIVAACETCGQDVCTCATQTNEVAPQGEAPVVTPKRKRK